jgi:diacylglycerol kinase family enzyme
VGAIAGELAGSPVALGVLPAGTANVLAKTLQLPRPGWGRAGDFPRAARVLLDSPAQLTDLGRANGHYFVMWAGMGLDALVTEAFEAQRARQRGAFAYNVALTFWAARHWHGLNLTLRATGPAGPQEARGHFLMATICHTGWHGGGLFEFARDFRLDDGVMDLWAFEGATYLQGLALMTRVLAGRHAGHPQVHRLTGDYFELEAAAPQTIQVDAEPLPATGRLEVRVLPRQLRLLVPRAAVARLYSDPRS